MTTFCSEICASFKIRFKLMQKPIVWQPKNFKLKFNFNYQINKHTNFSN